VPIQTTKLIRRLGATPVFLPLRHGYVLLNELQHRQRIQILSEITNDAAADETAQRHPMDQ
jgi:hypothetical protein